MLAYRKSCQLEFEFFERSGDLLKNHQKIRKFLEKLNSLRYLKIAKQPINDEKRPFMR